jgi:hypothetical protein
LPDISKINALDIGSVSKVDGLAKASILDIDGVAVPAVAPPLDTYTGAAAAYSVRLLRTAYTGAAMRVRRDTAGGTGDDDEADIAFDSGVISLDSAISNTTSSASTLGQFLNVGTVGGTTYTNPDSLSGTASCFVDEWKDQSGNANHASQATFGSQPQIHSGTVNTDLITENGKPAVDFDGTDDQLPIPLSGLNINNLSAATVCQSNLTSGNRFQFTLNTGSNAQYWHYMAGGQDTMWYGGSDTTITHGFMDTNQRLRTFIAGSTSGAARSFFNGTEAPTTRALVSATLTANQQFLGNYHTGSFYWDGTMQEFIVWGADQFNNRTGIETNINGFFGIY